MSKRLCKASMAGLLICFSAGSVLAQGIFDQKADWGKRSTYKVAGSATFSGGEYTLQGNGDDIWNNDDEGFYIFTEKEGDWSVSGKVNWVDHGADDWAKIGVMIREKGPLNTSRHYSAMLRGAANGDGSYAQYRTAEGGASSSGDIRTPDNAAVANPGDGVWLRATRLSSQNLFVAEYSLDGSAWTVGYAAVMEGWAAKVAYGLAITNHLDNELLAEGTASDVALTAAAFNKPIAFRSFSTGMLTQGGSMDVTIKVYLPSGTLTETVPEGWTASNISNGGTFSNGVVTWNLAAGVTEVKYTVKSTADASAAAFSGKTSALNTLGASSVNIIKKGVGIFASQMDIGAVGAAGEATLENNEYVVTGSGADIWGTADEFYFLFNEMSGAFSIKGNFYMDVGNGEPTWAKGGFMVRDELTAGAVNAFELVRSGGQRMIGQWRTTAGGESSNIGDAAANDDHVGDMELVRLGDTVNFYRYNAAGDKFLIGSANLSEMKDPVYVGIASTSHSDGQYSYAIATELQITEYPFSVFRTLSSTQSGPGGSVDVTVEVDVRTGKTPNIVFEDTISAGVTLSNIQTTVGTASLTGSVLKWTANAMASGKQTLKYTYTLPQVISGSGVYTISNSFSDGGSYTGTLSLSRIATFNFSPTNLGPFQNHQDIGAVSAAGSVGTVENLFAVMGSGGDIWGTADELHFMYRQLSGDFDMTVENAYIGPMGDIPSSNDWQKMGIMARDELSADSPYAYAMLRASDQNYTFQWRDNFAVEAAGNDVYIVPADHNGKLKLERVGDDFAAYYMDANGEWIICGDYHFVYMEDPIYVGIGVTSHEDGSTSAGVFTNPTYTIGGAVVPVKNWMLH